MHQYSNIKKWGACALLLLFLLSACVPASSGESGKEEDLPINNAVAFSPAPSSAPSDSSSLAVSPTPTVSSTPEVSPTAAVTLAPTPVASALPISTLSGTITAASAHTLTLAVEGGEATILLTDDTVHTGEGYLNGNVVTVSYVESQTTAQGILACAVAVSKGLHATSAEALLEKMTLAEKVAQMFFVRCPSDGAQAVQDYQFGGYILFGRDFEGCSWEGIYGAIASYQKNAKIPLFIGVDEEGGTVVRASANPNICDEPYWSPRQLFQGGGMEAVIGVERDKARVLQELGINVNFAPVCDISTGEGEFMYDRSLGQSPEVVSDFAVQAVNVYQERKMGSVLKHFPGYGNNEDTHTGIAVDQRPLESFQQKDLVPFAAGIQAGAPCVLVSHNIVTCLDPDSPASLSEKWHQYLREEMGFTGVIITDDLSMDAIGQYCDSGSAAVAAVQAGNDLLCCTDYEVQIPAVISAVENGTLSEERINDSVLRVLHWKSQMGLLG